MPVYMIRAGESGPVKIGWATDVARRVTELRTGMVDEPEVIRVLPGERQTEAWLHRKFAPLRVRGEWFRFIPAMLDIQPPEETSKTHPVAAMIDRLGGTFAVSRALCVPPTTVTNWKGRGSIPARYHSGILQMSGGSVTADQIIDAHALSAASGAA